MGFSYMKVRLDTSVVGKYVRNSLKSWGGDAKIPKIEHLNGVQKNLGCISKVL